MTKEEARENRKMILRVGEARAMHALLLRCEGMIYREIGDRLGVSTTRAQQLLREGSRRLKRAMKRLPKGEPSDPQ